MIKAVIYDVDNVLFATQRAVLARYSDLSVAMGQGPLLPNALDKLLGTTGDKIMESLFPGRLAEAKELNKITDVHYELMSPETGVKEALAKLKKEDVILAIATNRREYSLRPLLERYDLLKFFDPNLVFCKNGDEFLKGQRVFKNTFEKAKPDPECLNLALSFLSVKPAEAIYLGDERVDRDASEKAGLVFVGFKTSFNCPDRIEDHRDIFKYLK